jgi:hypothetical protein
MINRSIQTKIEKTVLMKKYVSIFNKNKNNNIFKDIFIMYVNDIDEKLQKIKDNKTKKGSKKIYNNNDFFYYSFINFMENGQSWRSMNNICSYSTYYRKFKLWTVNNVFINIYKIFIFYLKNNKILKYADLKNTFIDSSNIRNKQGIDCIERNYADKGKNATKISVITSKSGIPLSSLLVPCNVHDVKTVIKTIKNSYISLNKSKLGGDKGYISKALTNELNKKYDIKLITCERKKRRTKNEIIYDKKNKVKHNDKPNNKKNKKNTKNLKKNKKNNVKHSNKPNNKANNKKNTKFLKQRIIIENMFAWIKNNKRLQLRYDKYCKNYKSFVNLAFIKLVINRFSYQYFINNNIKCSIMNQRLFRIYRNKILKNRCV